MKKISLFTDIYVILISIILFCIIIILHYVQKLDNIEETKHLQEEITSLKMENFELRAEKDTNWKYVYRRDTIYMDLR